MADGKGKTVPGDRANVRKGSQSLELLASVRNSESLTAEERNVVFFIFIFSSDIFCPFLTLSQECPFALQSMIG